LEWLWENRAGGIGHDLSNCIATDNRGNSYVAGHFDSSTGFGTILLTSNGFDDIFIAILDTTGNWLWVQCAGGAGNVIILFYNI